MGMLPGGDSFRCTARKEYNRAVAYTVAAAAVLTERRSDATLSDGVRPKWTGSRASAERSPRPQAKRDLPGGA